jgi:hypothetical protein
MTLVLGSEQNLRCERPLLHKEATNQQPNWNVSKQKNGWLPTNSNNCMKDKNYAKYGDKLSSKNLNFQIVSSR